MLQEDELLLHESSWPSVAALVADETAAAAGCAFVLAPAAVIILQPLVAATEFFVVDAVAPIVAVVDAVAHAADEAAAVVVFVA